jgi:hypothetical protein
VGAGAAWLKRGVPGVFSWLWHHPHLENCRASSRQGREGASNWDAGTLTCGFLQESSRPGCLWWTGWMGVAVLGQGRGWGGGGWGVGGRVWFASIVQQSPQPAVKNGAELTLERGEAVRVGDP